MTKSPDKEKGIGRRRLLAFGAPMVLAFSPFAAAAASRVYGERKISMINVNTGESLSTIYWQDGRYVPETFHRINRHLRDWRTNEQAQIDPRLIDLLHDLRKRLDTGAPYQIISGYRSPETNQALRRASRKVARNSYHMDGMAIDVSLPDRHFRDIYRAAVNMQQGGVGIYRRTTYVHLDVGPVRTW